MPHDKTPMFALQVAVTKGQGGIVTAVKHYDRMFRAVGVRSVCLYRGPATDALRAEGIDVVEAPRNLTSSWGPMLLSALRMRREIRSRTAHMPLLAVVHSDRALGSIRGLFPHAVVVAPCHSDKSKRKRDADIVITLNPLQHAFVSAGLQGSRAKAAMIGNPFVCAPTDRLPKRDGPPRLNFCGRFIPTKDPLILLHAARLMKTRPLPEIRFIGDGQMEPEIRLAAEGCPATVSFAGWRPAPFCDFHRGDLLVHPSAWEGLPYVLQEALDAEIPSIASDVPGHRQLIGDDAYGSLFPLGDAAALASKIDAALSDPGALRRKAEEGRRSVHVRYGAVAFWTALSTTMAAQWSPTAVPAGRAVS